MTRNSSQILVVDDEPEIRAILAEYLAGAGYAALTAGSAEEASVALARKRYQGLILDLNLPGQDGLAFNLVGLDAHLLGEQVQVVDALENIGGCAVGWSGGEFLVAWWEAGLHDNRILVQRVAPRR